MNLMDVLNAGAPPARMGAVIPDGTTAASPVAPTPPAAQPLPPSGDGAPGFFDTVVPAPPMQSGPSGGDRFASIAKQLAPIIGSLVVAKKAGAPAAGAFLKGFLDTHAEQEVELQRQALVDTAAKEKLTALQDAKQKELSVWLQDLPVSASKISDPAAFASFLEIADAVGVTRYRLPRGTVTSMFHGQGPVINKADVGEAQALIKSIGTEALQKGLDAGAVVTFRGVQRPLKEVYALAGMPVTAQGAPVTAGPKQDTGGWTEADEVASARKEYDEAEKAAGRTPTEAGRRQAGLTARAKWANAGRVPVAAGGAGGGSGAGSGGQSNISVLGDQLVGAYLAPSQLGRRADYNAILADASRKMMKLTGKPYNAIKADADMKAALTWASASNSQQRGRLLGLVNSVQPLIDEVLETAAVVANRGWEFANKLEMETYISKFGNTERAQAYVRYLTTVTALKEEFAQLVQGGYSPTQDAFELAQKQVNENYGFKALNASLMELKKIIAFRANGMASIPAAYLNEANSPAGRGQGAGPGGGGNVTTEETQNGHVYRVTRTSSGAYVSSVFVR